METLTVPQGVYRLARYPERRNDRLRAWDAADEYLLGYLHEEKLTGGDSGVLILNDLFGALSVALVNGRPLLVSDSFLTHQGVAANLSRNGYSADQVEVYNSLAYPETAFDLILLKIPRSLALLEDQLHRLRPCMHPGTRIIGAGMVKHIHTSTLNLFERIIGPTKTSLARKKARLIFSDPDMQLTPVPNPYPIQYQLEGTPFDLINHAGVFSREKLDMGTRFLIEHMPATEGTSLIIDLGCGNGVLGLIAADRNRAAEPVFVDESIMAVASAEVNFKAAFGDRKARFLVGDTLHDLPPNSADLVLINPPFHQERGRSDETAQSMFREAKRVLGHRGELWIVGNRHLGYHIALERLFGNCRSVAGNSKFVILRSVKRKEHGS